MYWLTGIHSVLGPSKDHVLSSRICRNCASGACSMISHLPFPKQSNRACRKIQAVPNPPLERPRVSKMRSKRTRLSKGWSWSRSNRWYGWKYTANPDYLRRKCVFRSHSFDGIYVQTVQHWILMQRLVIQIDMAKF